MEKDKFGNTLADLEASRRYIESSLAYMAIGSEDYNTFSKLLFSLNRKISDFPY